MDSIFIGSRAWGPNGGNSSTHSFPRRRPWWIVHQNHPLGQGLLHLLWLQKPWAEAFGLLWFAGGFLASLGAGIMDSPICAILGFGVGIVIAAIYYALNKRMSIGLVEMSGVVNQIVFKRSVLEGINLDENSSSHASDVIQWLMDSARTGSGGVATSSTQQGHI